MIAATQVTATHELPPLPFSFNALEPIISEKTVRIHYEKHHKGYIDELNKLIADSEFVGMSLEQVIQATAHMPVHEHIFNNAAQAWNHTFYWRSLTSLAATVPSRPLQVRINAAFGDTAALKKELATAATSQFGSGWVWLALDGDRLKVVKTGNAGNVMTEGLIPVLVFDVWEHAYYLDFQNRRVDYVTGVLDKLINWEFAAHNLDAV
jgi:Fe-Mn family superoxide dismutase